MRAAAAGACWLPALGHADPAVAVYGLVDTTVQYTTRAGPAGSHSYSMGDGAFTGSRLGFRGAEDLGDRMKSFVSIEEGIDPSSGQLAQTTVVANYGQSLAPAGRAFGREALVGLTVGNAGTVTLGRQYTLANAYSGRFQPSANPNQEALALLVGHQLVRQDNMVKYTVDIGAFNVGASKTFGEGLNGSSWGVGAAYQQGSFDLAGYASEMDSFDHAETRRIQGVGGAFDLTGSIRAYVGAMRRSHRVSAQTNQVWVAALRYTIGSFVYTCSYGEDRQRHASDGARKLSWMSVEHAFSKRTDLYVVLDANRVVGTYPLPAFMATRATQTGAQLGVRHRFWPALRDPSHLESTVFSASATSRREIYSRRALRSTSRAAVSGERAEEKPTQRGDQFGRSFLQDPVSGAR